MEKRNYQKELEEKVLALVDALFLPTSLLFSGVGLDECDQLIIRATNRVVPEYEKISLDNNLFVKGAKFKILDIDKVWNDAKYSGVDKIACFSNIAKNLSKNGDLFLQVTSNEDGNQSIAIDIKESINKYMGR